MHVFCWMHLYETHLLHRNGVSVTFLFICLFVCFNVLYFRNRHTNRSIKHDSRLIVSFKFRVGFFYIKVTEKDEEEIQLLMTSELQ